MHPLGPNEKKFPLNQSSEFGMFSLTIKPMFCTYFNLLGSLYGDNFLLECVGDNIPEIRVNNSFFTLLVPESLTLESVRFTGADKLASCSTTVTS